ncbi:uncharacterized protein LOC134229024 [Saccostrea cucullata]|uniref:uncharacterized protein LOC134229024 n=1 Tax=Saccostrea cuccullata TaxID=36930 RepID=UPI002ED5DE09
MSTEKKSTTEYEEGATAGTFMSKEEKEQLMKTLEAMNLKPKADTPADLLGWMSEVVAVGKESGAIPKTPKTPIKPEPFSPFSNTTMDFTTPFKHPVRIAMFSGGKSDSTYELWRYEVTCLSKEGYSKDTIMNAIRRSLKGEPANVLMRLGPVSTIEEILQKFDSIYGNVLGTEDILAEFYSARQKSDEDCAAWSVRLEELLNQAVKKGKISPANANDMLRTMFYKGLRQELKDISGHIFQITPDFDKLRVAIRKIEMDHQPGITVKPKQVIAKSAQSTTDERFSQIQAQIQQLSTQIQQMAKPQHHNQPPQYYQYGPRPSFQRGRGNFHQYKRRPQYAEMPTPPEVMSDPAPATRDQQKGKIVCFRCHQEGHLAIGCRVKLDHQRKQGHLNSNRPNPGVEDQARSTGDPVTRKQ